MPKLPEFFRTATGSVLLTALVATIPFLPTLGNGLVWDDHVLIERNPSLAHPLRSFTEMTQVDYRLSPYYRPLSILLWALERSWFGVDPWGYHALNILLHVLVAVALLLLFRRFLPPLPALFGALLFATHPVHVEAVAFASAGATELLPSFLFLAAAWTTTRRDTGTAVGEKSSGGWLWASAMIFLLSLLAKEVSIVFPLIALVWFLGRKPAQGHMLGYLIPRLLPFIVATGLYGVLRVQAMTKASTMTSHGTMQATIEYFPPWLLAAARGLLFPRKLLPYHYLRPLGYTGLAFLVLLAALLALLLLALGRKRSWDPPFLLGVILLVLPLIPAMPFFPRSGAMISERFLYLPSAGLALLVAGASDSLWGRAGRPARRALAGAAAALVLLAGSWTFLRTGDWRDDLRLFTRAVERDPTNPLLHHLLGTEYFRQLNFREAERVLEKANALEPGSMDIRLRLAETYSYLGKLQKASALYRGILLASPANAPALLGLGKVKMSSAGSDSGEREFLEVMRLDPYQAEAYLYLGILAYRRGDVTRAEDIWKRGLDAVPTNPLLMNVLGVVARDRGDLSKARELFSRALAVYPEYDDARRNLEALR